jgi:hypothetical protein
MRDGCQDSDASIGFDLRSVAQQMMVAVVVVVVVVVALTREPEIRAVKDSRNFGCRISYDCCCCFCHK